MQLCGKIKNWQGIFKNICSDNNANDIAEISWGQQHASVPLTLTLFVPCNISCCDRGTQQVLQNINHHFYNADKACIHHIPKHLHTSIPPNGYFKIPECSDKNLK